VAELFSDEHRFDTMLEVELSPQKVSRNTVFFRKVKWTNCDNVVPLSTPNS